jgi:hypothetical protein
MLLLILVLLLPVKNINCHTLPIMQRRIVLLGRYEKLLKPYFKTFLFIVALDGNGLLLRGLRSRIYRGISSVFHCGWLPLSVYLKALAFCLRITLQQEAIFVFAFTTIRSTYYRFYIFYLQSVCSFNTVKRLRRRNTSS